MPKKGWHELHELLATPEPDLEYHYAYGEVHFFCTVDMLNLDHQLNDLHAYGPHMRKQGVGVYYKVLSLCLLSRLLIRWEYFLWEIMTGLYNGRNGR